MWIRKRVLRHGGCLQTPHRCLETQKKHQRTLLDVSRDTRCVFRRVCDALRRGRSVFRRDRRVFRRGRRVFRHGRHVFRRAGAGGFPNIVRIFSCIPKHIGLLTLFLIPSEKYGRLFAHPARFSMFIAAPAMLATSTKLGVAEKRYLCNCNGFRYKKSIGTRATPKRTSNEQRPVS